MKLVRAGFEILTPLNRETVLKSIEVAGRTCYKSEDKITEASASDFVKMIVGRGHLSVIEHQSFSVRFICDRGVSHELVRHRIASFSQESTRYCNYSKDKHDNQLTFVIPSWINETHTYSWLPNIKEGIYPIEWKNKLGNCDSDPFPEHSPASRWFWACALSERDYQRLIKEGWLPQQARSVLPNSLKTEIVITANLREWKEIFRQRCQLAAHPQMREIMLPLQKVLQAILPEIFGDAEAYYRT